VVGDTVHKDAAVLNLQIINAGFEQVRGYFKNFFAHAVAGEVR